MSRSLSNLRRALFGTSCVIVFGFGATEALANVPDDPFGAACHDGWEPNEACLAECAGYRVYCMNDRCLCAM